MLVFGLISPHPPIILPEVGGDELPKVRQTITALEHAAAQLGQAQPEALIIISPHEEHGFDVPMHFLRPHLPADIPVEQILVTEPSYQFYFDYGREVGERVRRDPKRYAIVASGDLSHVLKADGPYGFNAAGPVLDKTIVAAVGQGDAQALLNIDPATLEDGAECGLRSILFLLGAVGGMDIKIDVLSYEGPFGVGYMVATLESSGMSITGLARASMRHYLETGKVLEAPKNLSEGLSSQAGAFVTLHQKNGDLRGCIGTIAPTKATLAKEVIANAVTAATQDPRFAPVSAAELDDLEISVDVLSKAVPETDLTKLDPKTFGLIVSTPDGRQGVLLPNIEGVNTAAEQIQICREKGNIGPNEPVEIRKFQVARYIDKH